VSRLAAILNGVRFTFLASVFFLAGLWAAPVAAQCVTAGDSCNDGLYCTVGDTCDAALACVGTARDCRDGDPCTRDPCNESADRCDHPPSPAGTGCSDGEFCTEPDTCDGSGGCVAGPPRDCDDGLDCTNDSCDESANLCDNDLMPGRCVVRGDCYDEGDPDPRASDPCEQCIPSTRTNQFSQAPSGATCGAASCADGTFTNASTCDSAGACVAATPEACMSGACANATGCAGCVMDSDCPAGQHCAGSDCAPGLDLGASCTRDAECGAAVCADGVCCGRPCSGSCESCALEGSVGACTPHEVGTDPEDGCAGMGCDGAGACVGAMPDGATLDASGDGASPVDAARDGDGDGGNFLTAHGSGCVACAVGSGRDRPEALPLVLLVLGLAFGRLRRPRH